MNFKVIIAAAALVSGLILSPSFATASTTLISTEEHKLTLLTGETEKFLVTTYLNSHLEKEVSIVHEQTRAFLPKTSNVILFGRDLEGEGKISGWFYRDHDGLLQAIDEEAPYADDGWEVAEKILLTKVDLSDSWYLGVMLSAMIEGIENLSIAGSYFKSEESGFSQQELDLNDLYLRIKRLIRADSNPEEIVYLRNLLEKGWDDYSAQLNKRSINGIEYGALDGLIIFSGGAILKGAGRFITKASERITQYSEINSLIMLIQKYISLVNNKAIAVSEELGIKRAAEEGTLRAISKMGGMKLLAMTIKAQVDVSIRALNTRSSLFRMMTKGLGIVTKTAKISSKEWKYMTLTQSLQVGAEIYDKRAQLYDPNPIIMTKKVLTNKDFLQDFAFMSNETFWTVGIASQQNTVFRKIFMCGLFSIADSNLMNFAVRHETDLKRVTLDTSWEVIIGNSQTTLDLFNLSLFESKALTAGNPKLRLVGYGLGIIDQSAGYIAYGKVTEWYENQKATNKNHENNTEEFIGKPEDLRVFPIFAP